MAVMLTKALLPQSGLGKLCRAGVRCISNITTETGMSFGISPEQEGYKDLARKYTREHVMPQSAELDRTGQFPEELFKKAWDLGIMNVTFPQLAGGMGLGVMEEIIIQEEVSYGCTGVSTALLANSLASAPVINGGSEELQKKYLGRLTEAPLKCAYACTEPGAGSDVAGIRTKAVKKGDEYVINGEKTWITGAGVANWYFVLAQTNPNERAGAAFTGFVVESDSPGVTVGPKLMNLGQRCSDTRSIAFEDVRVPKENVVGQEGRGFALAMGAFDRTRPTVAIGAVGLAQRALEEATSYALDRKTMGTPIAQHQMIQSMLAEMAVGIHASRLLVRESAWLRDQGRDNTYVASLGKALAAEVAMKSATDAVQIFGGAGFNRDYPVEKLMRDAKIFSIYEGTTQIQKMIIARFLISDAQNRA